MMQWTCICCCLLFTVVTVWAGPVPAAEAGVTRERRNLFKKDTRAYKRRDQESAPVWSERFRESLFLQTHHVGSSTNFRCPAEGTPTPNITWLKNGKPFTSRPFGKIIKRQWRLRLEDLLVGDEGNYTCVVSNRHGKIQWTFKLDVVARPPKNPPFLYNKPTNETVFEGETVTFHCQASSDATTVLQWFKHIEINGSLTNEKGHANLERIEVGNPELVIENVTLDDAGMYTCYVTNTFGENFVTAWLTVLPPPPYLPPPLPVKIKSGVDWYLVVIPLVVLALLVVAVGLNVYYCEKRRRRQGHVIVMQPNQLYSAVTTVTVDMPVDTRWEIAREKIQLAEQLGEGAFGRVVKGYVFGIASCPDNTVVAVKMLKEDATERELRDLIQEIKMMKVIGSHVNIINLVGCCTQDGPVYVIVEYAAHGNLRDFLRSHRPPDSGYERPMESLLGGLTGANLLSFAYQVARGMEYLSGRKIIHRDLAARNVLVAENLVLKIADFGLTRYTNEEDYYKLSTDGRFPVKWMAPESLIDRKYSVKSDIWSFGVFLWEVFTLGGNPYPTVRVENLVQLLRDGHRMEPPPYGNVKLYSMMLKCWKWNARQRPGFREVVRQLDHLVAQAGDSEYLNLEPTDISSGPRTPRPSDSQYSSLSNASLASSHHQNRDQELEDTDAEKCITSEEEEEEEEGEGEDIRECIRDGLIQNSRVRTTSL